jgi:hypothetical protein
MSSVERRSIAFIPAGKLQVTGLSVAALGTGVS